MGLYKVEKGVLKTQRGKSLPVNVPVTANATVLQTLAIRKHVQFRNIKEDGSYVLLYPQGHIVDMLPGLDEEFVLSKYKQEIGKQYSRLQFYLCRQDQYTGEYGISPLHTISTPSYLFQKYSSLRC